MIDFQNKTVLITGGTGTFGQAFVKHLCTLSHPPREIRIFSRDEQKQYDMMKELPSKRFPLRYFIGDIRNRTRLMEVTSGVHYVIHSAAMKHMPIAESHPEEAIHTNVLGTQNLIQACLHHQVERMVALSTDKAAAPINTYGATKLLLEKLIKAANHTPNNPGSIFSIVRYANVFGSKGSVVPLFLQLKKTGTLPLTDPAMTRFSIDISESVRLTLFALSHAKGGEIVVPITPAYTVADLALAVGGNTCKHQIIGSRESEKMHEQLVTQEEAPHTIRYQNYYVICPPKQDPEAYAQAIGGQAGVLTQAYDSEKNTDRLSVEQIRQKLLKL